VIRPRAFFKPRIVATCLLLAAAAPLAGCTEVQKVEINAVMDARDRAICNKDIRAYSGLLLADYRDHGQRKADLVAQMTAMFGRFDVLQMHSFDRTIRVLDARHAQCAQSYRLRVRQDHSWRAIVEREQLDLQKTANGWKISAGL
jgi:hypothetical protein